MLDCRFAFPCSVRIALFFSVAYRQVRELCPAGATCYSELIFKMIKLQNKNKLVNFVFWCNFCRTPVIATAVMKAMTDTVQRNVRANVAATNLRFVVVGSTTRYTQVCLLILPHL